jgi:hypothetical protein
MKQTNKKGLYEMNISEGGLFDMFKFYYNSKEFNNAKCPLCKETMTYENSLSSIRFSCKNSNCIGYLRWFEHYRLSFNGHMGFDLK